MAYREDIADFIEEIREIKLALRDIPRARLHVQISFSGWAYCDMLLVVASGVFFALLANNWLMGLIP